MLLPHLGRALKGHGVPKNRTTVHYPFTELSPPSIVKTDSTDSSKFVHISLRISTKLRSRLKREAKRRHLTLNSYINEILARHNVFDKILETMKAIPLSEEFFRVWLQKTSQEDMEEMAKSIGPKVVRRSFASRGIEFNLDNLIEFYFEPLSDYSGWYQFEWDFVGASRRLTFTHPHGPKWTAFLRRYYADLIRSATGTEPEVTVEEGVITFTCR